MHPLTVLMLWLPCCPADCRLEDRDRFPPGNVCQAAEDFWKARLDYLQSTRPLESWHQDEWREQVRYAKWQFDCFDWLGAAQGNEGRDEKYWRYSLRRFRELVGDEAYFGGTVPQ